MRPSTDVQLLTTPPPECEQWHASRRLRTSGKAASKATKRQGTWKGGGEAMAAVGRAAMGRAAMGRAAVGRAAVGDGS
jgi:hypothetical protein